MLRSEITDWSNATPEVPGKRLPDSKRDAECRPGPSGLMNCGAGYLAGSLL